MGYLPIASIIYGLFLMFLSMRFSLYSRFEFASLVYGIFFLGFGIALAIIKIGTDFGLDVNDKNTWIWVFSVAFFATATHMLFKTARIISVTKVKKVPRVGNLL